MKSFMSFLAFIIYISENLFILISYAFIADMVLIVEYNHPIIHKNIYFSSIEILLDLRFNKLLR